MSKNPFANMGNLLKQAQEMQSKMGKIQEEAATKTVEASTGGGMVTVQANGAMQITNITIDPEVIEQNQIRLRDKIHSARNRITLFEEDIKENTDTLIISYGVTSRAVEDAARTLENKGTPVSTLTLKSLWPVPEDLLVKKAKPFKRIIVIEMNLGQYVNEIRRVLCDKKIEFYGQMNGVLITPAKIMEVIEHG
jgi:2-oxoglutarate ferredoxin oxidoreductase subunit alpha